MKTFVEIEYENHKAKSKCNVQFDDFNLHTGIDIAMERLEEIENPKEPELPKYVRYIGRREGGLKKGDICKVLSAANDRCREGGLLVASPLLFTYLWSSEYEPVTIYD